MLEIEVTRQTGVNTDRLDEDLKAILNSVSLRTQNNDRTVFVIVPEGTAQNIIAALQAAVVAHNQNALSQQQQIDAARIAIANGREYLKRQLASSNPDTPATIVGTLKPVVDGNPILTNMMQNQLTVMNSVYGWGVLDILTLLTPLTAIARNRYIVAAEAVIALLA